MKGMDNIVSEWKQGKKLRLLFLQLFFSKKIFKANDLNLKRAVYVDSPVKRWM